jgi:hypothetical protein
VADLLGPDVSRTVVRVVGSPSSSGRSTPRCWLARPGACSSARRSPPASPTSAGSWPRRAGRRGRLLVTGAVAALAVAAVVGGLGLLQLRAARR